MRTSEAGLNLIKTHEGLSLVPYLDAVGIATIGYGHAILDTRGGMIRTDNHTDEKTVLTRAKAILSKLTDAQALELLKRDLEPREIAVTKTIGGAPTTQNQFDALLSLAYNIGLGAFNTSSVVRFHVLGKQTSNTDPDTLKHLCEIIPLGGRVTNAPDSFLMWKTANGHILKGLVTRRLEERKLYLGDAPEPKSVWI